MTFETWWEKHKHEVGEAQYVAERWARKAWKAAKLDVKRQQVDMVYFRKTGGK